MENIKKIMTDKILNNLVVVLSFYIRNNSDVEGQNIHSEVQNYFTEYKYLIDNIMTFDIITLLAHNIDKITSNKHNLTNRVANSLTQFGYNINALQRIQIITNEVYQAVKILDKEVVNA